MRSLVFVSLFVMVGCGAEAGSPCSTPAATQCAGSTTLLSCEKGVWASYPCPSCSGTTCNWKGAANGSTCPESSAGDGWCPLDGRVLSCFWSATAGVGVFVESACSGCTKDKSLTELGKCTSGKCVCQ